MNNTGINELKKIFEEAYQTDPIVRNGFDAMSKIFIEPLIDAIRKGEDLTQHEENLKALFGIIGKTYNPEFPDIK